MEFFIDWQTTLECALCALVFASLLTLCLIKPLGVLQSFGYSNKSFYGWLRRKNNMILGRFALLALSCLLSCAVFTLSFSFLGKYGATVSLAPHIIFCAVYISADARYSFRGGATLTPRFKRLLIAVWTTFAVLIYLVVTALNFVCYIWTQQFFTYFKYCFLAAFPLLAPFIASFANSITMLWEKPINKSYIKKAKAKLAAANVTTVAITGSYGKTGVKNILKVMLAKKYEVLATPSSYNTPLGVAKTLNANELAGGGIFIVEMGARHEGDIKELCTLCPPDYSLITGICPQHLESFKSVEAIIATKGEIIPATKNTCFIAADAFELFAGIEGEKQSCGCVSEIEADCTGTSFTLTLGGESAKVKCKLLGKHSAANVGLCAQAAYALGVPFKDICEAVGGLDFTEHRLQLIESNGVNILDDGYNGNVVGARAALEVLRSFGGRHICVTPGIVELGILEESENAQLGKELAGLDFVILVGETLVGVVRDGYLEAGGDPEKIAVVPTLLKAQEKLAEVISGGDCVLFLNDLPDKYM